MKITGRTYKYGLEFRLYKENELVSLVYVSHNDPIDEIVKDMVARYAS